MVNTSPKIDDKVIFGYTDLTNLETTISPLFSSTDHRNSETEDLDTFNNSGEEDQWEGTTIDQNIVQKMLLDEGRIKKQMKPKVPRFRPTSAEMKAKQNSHLDHNAIRKFIVQLGDKIKVEKNDEEESKT